MQVIDESVKSIPLIEFQMVHVVQPGRGRHCRQRVTTVGVDRVGDHVPQPQPHGQHVAPHQGRSDKSRHQIGDHVLDRVRVEREDGARRRPFVVPLVHVLVHETMVHQSACNKNNICTFQNFIQICLNSFLSRFNWF